MPTSRCSCETRHPTGQLPAPEERAPNPDRTDFTFMEGLRVEFASEGGAGCAGFSCDLSGATEFLKSCAVRDCAAVEVCALRTGTSGPGRTRASAPARAAEEERVVHPA